MNAIVKSKSGFGHWSLMILLFCLVFLISSCGRYTKTPPTATKMPKKMHWPSLPKIQFTIQVGAFSTSDRAAAYADRLQAAGLDVYYFIDVDFLYKVRLERFNTRKAAMKRAMELKSLALIDDFFIVHPRPHRALQSAQEALGESIVETARRFIGTPYRWGGTSPEQGFDCSGLTMTVYRLNGLDLPRSSKEQFGVGTPVSRRALQPGDLVFFATDGTRRISHVGIYSGHGRFIHAPSHGKTIRSASLDNSYFVRRYQGARRYF